MMNFQNVYRIDGEDIITFLDDDWVWFGKENGAPELTRDKVVGTGLWGYIEGQETRELYQHLFERLRQRKDGTIVPCRCDSPDKIRPMDLLIQVLGEGDLEIRCRMYEFRAPARMEWLASAMKNGEMTVPMCSLCKQVQLDETNWYSLERLFIRIHAEGRETPRVQQSICPRCRVMVEKKGY